MIRVMSLAHSISVGVARTGWFREKCVNEQANHCSTVSWWNNLVHINFFRAQPSRDAACIKTRNSQHLRPRKQRLPFCWLLDTLSSVNRRKRAPVSCLCLPNESESQEFNSEKREHWKKPVSGAIAQTFTCLMDGWFISFYERNPHTQKRESFNRFGFR